VCFAQLREVFCADVGHFGCGAPGRSYRYQPGTHSTQSYTHAHSYTHPYTDTYSYTHAHPYTHPYTDTYSYTHAHPYRLRPTSGEHDRLVAAGRGIGHDGE
jgi:hypothetical protein